MAVFFLAVFCRAASLWRLDHNIVVLLFLDIRDKRIQKYFIRARNGSTRHKPKAERRGPRIDTGRVQRRGGGIGRRSHRGWKARIRMQRLDAERGRANAGSSPALSTSRRGEMEHTIALEGVGMSVRLRPARIAEDRTTRRVM